MGKHSRLFLTVLTFITHGLPSKFSKKMAPELNSTPLLSSLGGVCRLLTDGFSYHHDGSSMAFVGRVGHSRQTETWANKTEEEEGWKRWENSKEKRISPLLLVSSGRSICLISGFMTAFEVLSQVLFLS